ncbi:MAG: hypothetical protein M0R40_06795 [Firmicutes bacterium]|nr:hypothetical protein [Bacillota bacterium]
MTNEELVEDFQNGNEKALAELLELNKGIIYTLRNKWITSIHKCASTVEELEVECQFAFWLAVKDYKNDKECNFCSYAFKRIEWHLNRVFTKKVYKNSLGDPVSVVSLSDVIPGTDDLTYEDAIPDEDTEQVLDKLFEQCDMQSLHNDLIELLDAVVTEREKTILLMRYGIGFTAHTQSKIATKLNISGTRVAEIEKASMEKLKNSPVTLYLANKYHKAITRYRRQEKEEQFEGKKDLEQKINTKEALYFFGIRKE